MTDHPILCSSIERGDISDDGKYIVLYAEYNSVTYNIFVPATESSRLISLINGLMQDASKRRNDNTTPVFAAKKIEFMPDHGENREIIRIQLGEDTGSSLYFAVPPGKLVEMAKGILTVLGQASTAPPGKAH